VGLLEFQDGALSVATNAKTAFLRWQGPGNLGRSFSHAQPSWQLRNAHDNRHQRDQDQREYQISIFPEPYH
jgi:hypothetical protein